MAASRSAFQLKVVGPRGIHINKPFYSINFLETGFDATREALLSLAREQWCVQELQLD